MDADRQTVSTGSTDSGCNALQIAKAVVTPYLCAHVTTALFGDVCIALDRLYKRPISNEAFR